MDLDLLRPLYTATPGDVVSVHLDTSREDQDADKRLELTWRDLRRDLAAQGVGEETLEALDGQVGSAPHIVGPQGESLFAANGKILGSFALSEPPAASRGVVGLVADPLETVLDLDHQLPYIVIALDREGGDIDAYPAGAFDPESSRTYDGTTLHLSRVGAGGPSMASYHRRAVNAWTDNAAGVAREAAEAATGVDARVAVIAGDPKAIPLLREELAAQGLGAEIVEVPGGRRDDAAAAMREAVEYALADISRADHERMMTAYSDALGRNRAVHGIPAVIDALARGSVDTLLLSADRSADPMKWATAEDAMLIASAPEALGEYGEKAFEGKAGPLMLRAAAAGGASFSELLPGVEADDGCAAILRYAK
ncbi:hypothetical protein KDL01_32675 [Actinospica durhamensis]|uniref:Peptide chain release factor 1 n=1 Tax=Actinospica durhamensis TaxID=1508375 RepID=A0A941EZH1_9ACTN|nr:Vms1/Ankzf1 family peptidyl-tRNA hydrolase [Actinospica durhamensis]MBR7838074.1 hypothetical protein [Actinospica durhamensis]